MIFKKVEIKKTNFTPMSVCALAIRKCYGTENKADNGGDKDKSLIYKVGNKHRHGSVLEHLRFTFITSNPFISYLFVKNNYSKVTHGYLWLFDSVVTTNFRVVQGMVEKGDITLLKAMQIVPKEYRFLLPEEDET